MLRSDEIIKSIEQFLVETECSGVKSNTLIINSFYHSLIKKDYPYIVKDCKYYSNGYSLDIILTEKDVISVGLCYSYTKEDLKSIEGT